MMGVFGAGEACDVECAQVSDSWRQMMQGACVCMCVFVTVIEKHWCAEACVLEDGIMERQTEAAGNEQYELYVLPPR